MSQALATPSTSSVGAAPPKPKAIHPKPSHPEPAPDTDRQRSLDTFRSSTTREGPEPDTVEGGDSQELATALEAAYSEDGSSASSDPVMRVESEPTDSSYQQMLRSHQAEPNEPSQFPNSGEDGSLIVHPGQSVDQPRTMIVPETVDADRPSVMVLDDFRKDRDADQDGQSDYSHGGMIARRYATNGFNVFGFQALPEGSALSMSFGADRSIETIGRQFGLELTPDNLADQRYELGARIAKAAEDPALLREHFPDGELPPDAFHSPEEVGDLLNLWDFIDDARGQGFRVIGAGSNNEQELDGPVFSPEFLFADASTSNTTRSGSRVTSNVEDTDLTTNSVGSVQWHPILQDGQLQGWSANGEDGTIEFGPDEISSGAIPRTRVSTTHSDGRTEYSDYFYPEREGGNSYAVADLARRAWESWGWFDSYSAPEDLPTRAESPRY